MKRLKIAIIFGTKPNFDWDAFKYFILYVNRIQNSYEFFFPDVENYVFDKKKKERINWELSVQEVRNYKSSEEFQSDHSICIVTNSFDNNYFFNTERDCSIITTDIWDKHFSPPSLFEYLLHCIFSCLVYSQVKKTESTDEQMIINIGSHKDTRGCIADFTRQKYDDRIDIVLGYICDKHQKEIKDFYGDEYLTDLKYVIERNWIGDLETKNSPAFNLKHIFKFDIFKDSGFEKTFWDKIKVKFHEIPGTLIGEVIKLLLTVFITYYLIKIGLVAEK